VNNYFVRRVLILTLVLPGLLAACSAPAQNDAPSETRTLITSVGDLPRFDYQVGTSSMTIVTDDVAFRSLATRVASDRIELLRTHRFSDEKQTRRWYRSIALLYDQIPDHESAARYRALANDKAPAHNLGSIASFVEAELHTGGGKRGDPQYDERFAREFKAKLREVPFHAIREELVTWRGLADVPNEDGIRAVAESITDPKLKASNGVASDSVVAEIVNWRSAYRSLYWLPLVGPIAADILDQNALLEREGDLWTPRQIVLDATMPGTEVRIGVWDTGVDPDVLGGAMWLNRDERSNGIDDDGNGFIDDLHGIALTSLGTPRPGTMRPAGTLARPYDELLGMVIAEADLLRGVENSGTLAFKQFLQSLSVNERAVFDQERAKIAGFIHGTHVASIAVAGNPFARIVAAAHGYPDETEDTRPPSLESVIVAAESRKAVIRYFREQGVRVVTMSWITSAQLLEAEMERHGVGGSAEERGSLARAWFAENRSRLEAAIREAPEILFICGAGNFSDDVDFAEYSPAGLQLPNLVTVGAVDALDRPASFTSSGKGVWLYANGSNIEGLVPGGRTAVFSGTSGAVPQVANLAAKLLAISPALKPEEILRALRETGVTVVGLPEARSINPKQAVAHVRRAK